jgi:hypothetical protein
VESCTAICETHEGQFELVKWSAQLQPAPKAPKAPKEGGVLRLRRRKTMPDIDVSEAQRQASQR